MEEFEKKRYILDHFPRSFLDQKLLIRPSCPQILPGIDKIMANLKVSKFQKQIFLFSFEPKTKQNYLLISALRI